MEPILKFEIGEQYELHEFLLEYHTKFMNSRNIEYMVYKYFGNDIKSVLGFEIKRPILLCYNADILSYIIIYFEADYYRGLKEALDSKLALSYESSKNTIWIEYSENLIYMLILKDKLIRLTINDDFHEALSYGILP